MQKTWEMQRHQPVPVGSKGTAWRWLLRQTLQGDSARRVVPRHLRQYYKPRPSSLTGDVLVFEDPSESSGSLIGKS